jgi:CRISPR-associated protein Cmr3
MTTTLALTPVDAWFFGDGRPYNRMRADQTNVRSLFPPYAPTVVGAVRAAAARKRNWDGRSPWNDELKEKLGDGLCLGPLDFRGPMILRTEKGHWKRLYPAPLHLLGKEQEDGRWQPSTLLAPGSRSHPTDAGPMRLPRRTEKKAEGAKRPTGVWLTRAAIERVLAGETPDADGCVPSRRLWKYEPRVGLAREHQSRTAREGELYSPAYVRLEKNTAVGTQIRGLDPDDLPDCLMLGGESRMAQGTTIDIPSPPKCHAERILESGGMTAVTVTPLRLEAAAVENELRPGAELGEAFGPLAGATLASACIGKPEWIGGWHPKDNRPLPLTPHVPAGSTLFLEPPPEGLGADPQEIHGAKIGQRTAYGFGEILVGTWPEIRCQ